MLQETVTRTVPTVDRTLPVVPEFNPKLDRRGVCCSGLPIFASTTSSAREFNDYMEIPAWYTSVLGDLEYDLYKDGELVEDFEPSSRSFLLSLQSLRIFRVLEVSWRDILIAHGPGKYYFQFRQDLTTTYTSFEYNLREFHAMLAGETTRLTYTKNSIIGGEDQKFKYDYIGSNFRSMIRLPNSHVDYAGAPVETDTVRLDNGFERPYKKEFRDRHTLVVRACATELMAFFRFEILQCDTLVVDDYSIDRPCGFRLTDYAAEVDGDFDPILNGNATLAALKLPIKDAYNNRRKLFS
jgi:hypothetical protein